MKRKLISCFVLVFVILFGQNFIFAQEPDFRFNNWPIDVFSKERIINAYSNDHFAIDIAAPAGTEVKAVADGKVYWTYTGGSHGIAIGIEHQNGWRTTYLHLDERFVKKTQSIKAGEVIGKVGTTGNGRDADEAHLHFALIVDAESDISKADKRYIDPLFYGPLEITNDKEIEERVEEKTVVETESQSDESVQDKVTNETQEVGNVAGEVINESPNYQEQAQVIEDKKTNIQNVKHEINNSVEKIQVSREINRKPLRQSVNLPEKNALKYKVRKKIRVKARNINISKFPKTDLNVNSYKLMKSRKSYLNMVLLWIGVAFSIFIYYFLKSIDFNQLRTNFNKIATKS